MPQNKATFQFTHLIFGRICDEVHTAAAWEVKGHQKRPSKRSTQKRNNTQRDQFARQHQKEKGQKMGKKRARI